MKTRLLIVVGTVFFSILTNEAYAACSAEYLQWWQACNDTGPNNSLPLNPVLLLVMFGILAVIGIIGTVVRRINAKTRLLIIASTLLLAGIIVFTIGIHMFLETQATEERLLSSNEAGRSTPTISYDGMWGYFGTGAVFFVLCGFLLVWRNRK